MNGTSPCVIPGDAAITERILRTLGLPTAIVVMVDPDFATKVGVR